MGMPLGCGRKPEDPEKTQVDGENMQTPQTVTPADYRCFSHQCYNGTTLNETMLSKNLMNKFS